MNVFGVGPLELVVVIVVALIFVGPERLPRLAADLARTIREVRKYTGSIAAEFNEVVKDIEKETEAERTEWKDIGRGLSDASKSVSATTVCRPFRTTTTPSPLSITRAEMSATASPTRNAVSPPPYVTVAFALRPSAVKGTIAPRGPDSWNASDASHGDAGNSGSRRAASRA